MTTTTEAGEAVRTDRISFWLDSTADDPSRDATLERSTADVVVVGGGIVGLTCAFRLAAAGLGVVVLEAGRVCAGVSGYTTAKLTAGHGLVYSHLEEAHGSEAAALYGQAQTAGLDFVRELVATCGIECDLEAQPNVVFAEDEAERALVEAETAAARRAGLRADVVVELDVPFPTSGAVVLPDQAQLHPREYLLRLAALTEAAGAQILTGRRVTAITGTGRLDVRTESGGVAAPVVIVATHYPIVEQGFFVPRIHPRRSYVVAAPLAGPAAPGMYINVGRPTRSVRTARLPGGERLLLVGGEGHRVGQEQPLPERFDRLERWMRAHFAVGGTRYRWSTQDNHSVDRLPFFGPTDAPGLYVATGFGGWGMTNGTAAALAIAGAILGEELPWARLFRLDRATLAAGAARLLAETANVAVQEARGLLAPADDVSIAALEPGEGVVVSLHGLDAAVSRTPDGALHAVRAACTHMGCRVSWNAAESSWDCPCHGSRFAPDGRVLHGPALHPLEPVDPRAGA